MTNEEARAEFVRLLKSADRHSTAYKRAMKIGDESAAAEAMELWTMAVRCKDELMKKFPWL